MVGSCHKHIFDSGIALRDQLVLGSCIIGYAWKLYCWSILLTEQDLKSIRSVCMHIQWLLSMRPWMWKSRRALMYRSSCGSEWVLTAQSGISSGWTNSKTQNILCWLSDHRTILGHCHRCVTTGLTMQSSPQCWYRLVHAILETGFTQLRTEQFASDVNRNGFTLSPSQARNAYLCHT